MFNRALDKLQGSGLINQKPQHLKARLIVGLILIAASIVGVILTDFVPNSAWIYWCYAIPIFAIMCIALSWYVARHHEISGTTVWHEILHWIGLLAAVYVVSYSISTGFTSDLNGGLFILILLALSMYLAGIYYDSMYIFIGILLGILALIGTFFLKYFTLIVAPIVVIFVLLILWRYSHSRKKIKNEQKTSQKMDDTDSNGEEL